MSHFCVMVIGNNPEQQLAPYQENNRGDCPEEFLQFNDVEDEHLEEYKTKAATKVVMPDGRLLNPWDEEFRVEFGHEVPAHLEQREVPFAELFTTFEEYMSDWCGHKSRDSKNNRYGCWENPNSKWDWYELGGRRTGFLKIKPEGFGLKGKPGFMTDPAKDGYADAAIKADIDIEGMRNEAAEKAEEQYDKIMAVVGSLEGFIPWPAMCEKHGDDVEAARKEYHDQPAIVAKSKVRGMAFIDLEGFMCTKQEFVQQARDSAITTFAVLKDGKWHERGERGWWGFVSDEKDNKEWQRQFNELFDSLPDDTLISIYDCHI